LKKIELVQVNELDITVVKIKYVNMGINQPGHTHCAFLAHAQSMTIASTTKDYAIGVKWTDAEECRLKLKICAHIFQRHFGVITLKKYFSRTLLEIQCDAHA